MEKIWIFQCFTAFKNLKIFVKAVRVLNEAMIFLKEVTRVVIATVRVMLEALRVLNFDVNSQILPQVGWHGKCIYTPQAAVWFLT